MTWAWIELRSPRIKQIRQAMAAEFDNLLQAWFWALERGLERRVDPVLLSFLFYFSMLFDPGACDRLAEQSIRVVEKRDLTERSNRLLLARLLAMHAGGPPWDISGRFIQNARRSLEIIQELDAQQELAIWHSLLLGTLAPELGPQKSLALFQEPLSHLRRFGDPWGIAFTLRMIAEVALWNDDAAGAYPPIQEALQIDSSQGDLAGLSMDYSILRSIRALEKDIPAALAATERQQEIQAEIGDRVGSAASLYDIGTTYLAVSDFPKAAEYFHKTQLVLEEFDFRAMVSSMLSWRSIMAVRMGELDMARRLRQENQQLARQLAYLNEIVWGWAEMGEIERICLNFSTAEACYQTALQTAAEKRVPNLVSFVNRGLGQIKLAQGDADGAAYLFSQAAANAHDDHFTWGEVYALAELGQARALLADFTQGWLALRQAYVLYPVVETSMQLILAASLAELLLASGETVQAAERAAYVGFQQAAMFETRRQCEALLTLCETRLPPYKLAGAIQRGRNLSLESALIPLASP
jgi:tetratricopeptide (TPR) repeat protein